MTDKFRTVYPINITFAPGEEPTDKKLNAINKQTKAAFGVVEKAIGDLWNQGGDTLTANFPLRITNLARALGDQESLSPALVFPNTTGGITTFVFQESLTAYDGQTELVLKYSPESVSDTLLAASMSAVGYSTRVASRDLIDAVHKWCPDLTAGKIYLGKALVAGSNNLTYTVTITDVHTDGDTPNVIPPFSQDDWNGIKISQISSNKYWIVLPFRRPLDESAFGTTKLNSSTNTVSISSPSTRKWWGPVESGYSFTAGVSDVAFYRHKFSEAIRDIFDSEVAGTTIPSGYLFLWNQSTSSIVEGVTFKIPDSPITLFGSQVSWVLQIEGINLDSLFSSITSSAATEAVSHYNSGFSILCAGNSVTEAVKRLRDEFVFTPDSESLSARTSHSNLSNVAPGQETRYPIALPPSYLDGDDHSYLLSRSGSASSFSARRDLYNNGMIGDLLMLSTTSGENYQNLTGDSNRIWFNAVDSGVSVYRRDTGRPGLAADDQDLVISNGWLTVNGININDARIYYDGNRNLAFADDGSDINMEVWASSLVLTGDSPDINSWNGNHDSQTDFVRIVATSSGNDHQIEFGGANLDLSGNGASTASVKIGQANSLTHLQLANSKILFGSGIPSTVNDSISFNDSTNTFTFSADATDANIDGIDTLTVGTVDVTTVDATSIISDTILTSGAITSNGGVTTTAVIYSPSISQTKFVDLTPVAMNDHVSWSWGNVDRDNGDYKTNTLTFSLSGSPDNNDDGICFQFAGAVALTSVTVYGHYNETTPEAITLTCTKASFPMSVTGSDDWWTTTGSTVTSSNITTNGSFTRTFAITGSASGIWLGLRNVTSSSPTAAKLSISAITIDYNQSVPGQYI